MRAKGWVFRDNPNVMVMTTKDVVYNKREILSVWHDSDDGMWQFLDGPDVNEEVAMLVSLEEMVNIDESIVDIADLPLGWVAWREQKGLAWERQSENA
jgi:hypothetical protein